MSQLHFGGNHITRFHTIFTINHHVALKFLGTKLLFQGGTKSYFKVGQRQLFQSGSIAYLKVGQLLPSGAKCYFKVGQLFQSGETISKRSIT